MSENKKLLELMELCGHFLYHRRGGKHGQTKILRILSEQNELSQRKIQDILEIKSASLSEIVRKMEAEGLVIRKKQESDKRNIMLTLTEKGKEAAKENVERLLRQEEILFDALTKEEQKQLYNLLNKLIISWKNSFEKSLFQHKKGK